MEILLVTAQSKDQTGTAPNVSIGVWILASLSCKASSIEETPKKSTPEAI